MAIAGQYRRRKERNAEQQIEAERRAEKLGQVGRHRHQLRRRPTCPRRPGAGNAVAADLGQVAAGGDAELGREDWISIAIRFADDDDPDQQVAVLAPPGMLVAKLPGST